MPSLFFQFSPASESAGQGLLAAGRRPLTSKPRASLWVNKAEEPQLKGRNKPSASPWTAPSGLTFSPPDTQGVALGWLMTPLWG